jgi:glycerophosphoryl diester phosphodiesterase
VALLRRLGLAVLFWTVNTESVAARTAGLADFVVTDEVEKMRDYFHPA